MLRLLIPLCFCLLPLQAPAQVLFKNFSEVAVRGEVAPAAQARSYALIIANSDYDSEVIADLPVTRNDARAMLSLFRGMGYPEENIRVLENLDRRTLEDEVYSFAQGLAEQATVVVYYSGHGLTFDGDSQNYIVPVDMQTDISASDSRARGVFFKRRAFGLEKDILDILKIFDPAGIVVFYDACRNAPFDIDPNARKSVGAEASFVPARVDGTAIFYSARRGQESIARLDSDGADVNLSLYTRVLVSELSANPAIRLRDLHPRLNGQVAALAMEGTGNRLRQDPSMELELDYSRSPRHEFCLASVMRGGEAVCAGPEVTAAPAAAPAPQPAAQAVDAAALELAFWQDVTRRNTRFHYEQYLAAYPGGTYATEAAQAIAQLETRERAEAEMADWQQAQAANSAEGYQRFLAAHPDSAFREMAEQMLGTLRATEADEAAWSDAQAQGTAEAFRRYLATQPSGRYRAEADRRLAALSPQYPVCHVDDVRPPDAWLTLRSQPGGKAGANLANMPSGTAMELLGPRSGDWLQVRTAYGTGWVSWQVQRWIRC
ncbi:MAG: SH3 domain-containing protein [Rhodobacteraceae bacterium]|nr:SH3 domain-containing protein [Paracoccaceae bacterium]MBR9819437.1 SH3 domain-containing protein [Paracoccaceae bacterium]